MSNTKAKLAELRLRQQEREIAEDAHRETLELEELELEERLISEGYGKRGVGFDIAVTSVGCVAVRKPDYTIAKKFNAGDKTDEDVASFVIPCLLHPKSDKLGNLFLDHGGIAWRCAQLLLQMYEAKRVERSGK